MRISRIHQKYLIIFGKSAKSLVAYMEINVILEWFFIQSHLRIREKYFSLHGEYAEKHIYVLGEYAKKILLYIKIRRYT
jgi:hypothetical protein